MSVRIRLQRYGRKARPFYHIVTADQRSKRDGRLIERIGSYDPTRNPALIDLDFDKALKWIEKGAQPSDTCRAILSYKGVLMRDHLNRGVKKGALTQEQADAKFEKWLEEKQAKIAKQSEGVQKEAEKRKAEALKAEAERNEKRRAEIEARNAEASAEEQEVETATEEAPAEEGSEEAPAQEAKAEEKPAEEVKTEEKPEAEAKEEEKKDEKSE
ncbi:MAG: 30S ribosomal protein S16 [Salibacter sp.]|jgi:small subunit ribosomal protein S16|uniref:30S ribosomal protein S16 n=1 Tax=Salibacter sp. TaxID=2010995 RepID=UPI002870627C|nr:30S ribosomal protein S16 [Salibacter sp.]MDR9397869.1 30S ribosomal protein S16 [Salibacter sp.]